MAEKKGIILSRVSTESQDYSPQTNELISYSKSLGYTEVKIIETKESGFIDYESKDGYKQVIDFITENPQYNTVFVSEISRISRRKSVLGKIQEDFVKKKIQLYIKDKGYKLLNDDGTLNESTDILFTMYAYFAESEMRIKKERFQRSKKHLFAQGISLTGKLLFGYNKEKIEGINKNKLVISSIQAEQINVIFDWYINGIDNDKTRCSTKQITLECISRGFDKYTHSQRNIKKLLKEEAYTGSKTTANNYTISYPLIIKRNIFDSVQKKLYSKNTNAEKSTKHLTILSRIIKCPKCNGYLTPEYRVKDGYVSNIYYCANRKSIKKCEFKNSISMTVLDSAVWSSLYNTLQFEMEQNIKKDKKVFTENLEIQINNLNSKKDDLVEQIKNEERILRITLNSRNINRDSAIEEYEKRINKIDNEIAIINNEIRNKKLTIENARKNKEREYSLKDEINNNLVNIEKNKDLIKKYIKELSTEIEILYTDSRYTVIEIYYDVLIEDETYKSYDRLIINKVDNSNIKLRSINYRLEFINNKFVFFYKINNTSIPTNNVFTIEDIANMKLLPYNHDWMAEMENVNNLNFSMKDIEYRKLLFPN